MSRAMFVIGEPFPLTFPFSFLYLYPFTYLYFCLYLISFLQFFFPIFAAFFCIYFLFYYFFLSGFVFFPISLFFLLFISRNLFGTRLTRTFCRCQKMGLTCVAKSSSSIRKPRLLRPLNRSVTGLETDSG